MLDHVIQSIIVNTQPNLERYNKVDQLPYVFLQLSELKLSVEGLEKERDFYFRKLRDIELVCQDNENDNQPMISRIIDVLYATEVNNGVTLHLKQI